MNCPDTECIEKKVKIKKSRIARKSLPIADGEVKLVENKGSILGSDEPSITLSMKQEKKKIKSKNIQEYSKKVIIE